MLFSEALELLLPLPIYLVGTLLALVIYAYRKGVGESRSRAWRWRHWIVATAVWAWVGSTPAIGNAWLRVLEGDPQAPLPAQPVRAENTLIVVLGSGEMFSPRGKRQVRLDQTGWERVYGAVSLWRQTGGRLLFTGGPGGDTSASIAGAMGRIAADLGVPADRIELTSDSLSTFEDLKLSRSAIQRATGPVWLVTSAAHMPRALGVTRSLGLSVLPFRVNYRQILDLSWQAWLPHNRGPERFALVLHEAIGALVYDLRDRSD